MPIARFSLLRSVILAPLAILASLSALPALGEPSALHTVGSALCNSAGQSVVLKGVDICSLEWDRNGDHVLQSVGVAIDRWHVSLIRLPISQDFWEGRPAPSDGGAAYRALVDKIVRTASQNDVYVLVDLHWSDMGHWGSNIGQHDMPDENTAIAWRDIASHFANNPAVLFDAYNEPHDVSWGVWRNGGSVVEGATTYRSPGMQGLVDIIRATGARNMITVGGLDWAYDLTGIAKGYAIAGTNIMYSTHIYPASDPNWDANVAVAAKYGPILVGEFGAEPSNDYAEFEPKILAWITSHHYSACAWCMHPSASPCLISDWNYTPTFNEGTYVYSWLTGGTAAPADVQTTGAGNQITVSWSRVRGATSYDVYRSATPGHETAGVPIATGITAPVYVDTNAASGQTYYYRVTAVSSRGVSGVSEESGATSGVVLGFGPPVPSFSLTATASPAEGVLNAPVVISVVATNTSKAPATALLIALQIRSSTGSNPTQQTKDDPGIDPGKSKTFVFTWTPTAAGSYTINLGAFGAGWSPHYTWVNAAATVKAQ